MTSRPTYNELLKRVHELEIAESNRKKTETALQESEDRYRTVSELTSDYAYAYTADPEGNLSLEWVTGALKRITGYTREEVHARGGWESLIYPEDIRVPLRQLKSLLSNQSQTVEYRIITKSNEIRWMQDFARPVWQEQEGRLIRVFGAVQDITTRKHAEESALAHQERFKKFFSSVNDAIFVHPFQKEGFAPFVEVNDIACQRYGYSREEFLQRTARDITKHSEGKAHAARSHRRKLFEKEHLVFETVHLKKSGEAFPVEINANIIEQNGRPMIISVVRDISGRRSVETALRESDKRYKSLANNLNVGVYRNSVGPKGKFLEANSAIIDMFGYDNRDEFLNVAVSDLYLNPDSRNEYNRKILENGAVRNEELQLIRKNGTVFTGSVSAVVVKDGKGNVQYYDGIIEDITERKRAETALRESEEKYRTVLEANPDPVVLSDIEGKVIYFNPAFTRVFGWDLKEQFGKKMDAFVPEEAWQKTAMMIEKVLVGETFSGIETSRYNKYGKIVPVSISGAVYRDQGGNPVGSVINLRDISGQKKMEAQLQQAQKMEAIGTLAGGIAHDFNNMLVPLVGYSELLKAEMPTDSPLHGYVDEIIHVYERLKDLVRQILTFSRQSDQNLMPIKLQTIVKAALKLLRSSIPTIIDIQQDIGKECGVVIADATQMHQIVMNLATNSYHSMEDTGGQLSISLYQIHLETGESKRLGLVSGQYAHLTVADTGVGIDEEVLDKIFDPYFTTKEIGKGTGLGLSVVQGIVKSCNGNIHVDSKPGVGTCVHVYLPVVDHKGVAPRTEDDFISIKGGSEKILLVDDEEVIVRIEKEILERLGYSVTTRMGSVDALEAFKANADAFDLVVTDMTMPNMTGVQLAAKLKQIRPDIPIVLCTGFSYQINKEKSQEMGIQGFIMKPVIMKDMASIIRKVLDLNLGDVVDKVE